MCLGSPPRQTQLSVGPLPPPHKAFHVTTNFSITPDKDFFRIFQIHFCKELCTLPMTNVLDRISRFLLKGFLCLAGLIATFLKDKYFIRHNYHYILWMPYKLSNFRDENSHSWVSGIHIIGEGVEV